MQPTIAADINKNNFGVLLSNNGVLEHYMHRQPLRYNNESVRSQQTQ